MLCSWIQVGGFLPNLRERHGGSCWGWVCSPFSLFIWGSIPLYIPTPVFLFPFIFQGLVLLKRVSSLQEEAHKLEVEAQHLETEGLGKMEELWQAQRWRIFMGF